MKNKEKIDKAINAVAAIAIIAFFIGAMFAIWIGFVGVKILLSAVVLFIGDYVTSFWVSTVNKEKQRKEKALKNVSVLFGEDAAPEKRIGEGIVSILRAAVEEIYSGGLAKVTLNLRGGVKASISQNSKGEINVERTETKKQKLTE